MAWTLQLATRTGARVGEIRNARARSLRFPLNRTPTVQFAIDAFHPLAPLVVQDDLYLVKAYDDSTGSKVLRQCAPIIGHEKARSSTGGSITVTAAGPQSRLDRRLIGKHTAGATFGTTSLSMLDRGEIMGRIIDALNTGENTNIFTRAGDTGIRRGTITASTSTYVSDWRYKGASEALAQLSGTLDGPDWEIVPVEPVADAIGVQIGALNVAPVIGQARADVAFEFGGGRANVAEWKEVGDASSLATEATSLPPGFPDNATADVVTWDDAAAIALRGLHETVVPADLQVLDLRTKLVQDHVRVRKQPRKVITFSPIAESSSLPANERRVPRPFVDYIVGDVVRFRATETFPVFDSAGTQTGVTTVKTVDALMRIFAVQIDLDDGGVASTSLTLQSE